MTAYRFCRTDDIGLLVEALNRCWLPYFPGEPPMTPAAFKRSIRDLQVWCSNCMVALAGSDPVGVLIGAKRAAGTLVYRLAVHPDHRRQGHGRHLLSSLGSKLAILGPRRIVAEVPETLAPACELFEASGYTQEARLTDYVFRGNGSGPPAEGNGGEDGGALVIPVTVNDLAVNGLLQEAEPVCWQRSVHTLTAGHTDISGLAVASDERIEAGLLYMTDGMAANANVAEDTTAQAADVEILWLRSFVDDGGARLARLLSHLAARGLGSARLSKVHPAEFPRGLLETLGLRPTIHHRLYAASAQ
ncbi:MAG TPA: GNAT family N-acetyltransferase [Vicinamibacterales bacterium]